jgi:hypothetical protein
MNCFGTACSCSAGRRGGLHGPRIWSGRWRGCPDLWNQNPRRIPRLEIDLRGHEEGNLNDLRAQLGNDVAIKAYREGQLPFPDGTIIAALHWNYVSSEKNNKVFGRVQSFIAGAPKNIQFMVKDSKKYAATGGWGFADFTDGKPADEAVHKTCFPCHEPAKARDFVFTRYAP